MSRRNLAVLRAVLAVAVPMLVIFACVWVVRGLSLFRQTRLATTQHGGIVSIEPRRRYSTTDEMLYILYGEGEQFCPYDQQLINYIRSHISEQSPTRRRRLATPYQRDASQVGQSALVDKLLSGRRDGFFVECGAADGEKYSNSLFFELERNWTGLLIESNPDYHRALLRKNRRAFVLGSCLSIERRPTMVRVRQAGLTGGISDTDHQSNLVNLRRKKQGTQMNCFPLNAIMSALDVAHIDYFSLDVEGPEIEILHTIDWMQLRIDVISVEYRINDKSGTNKEATLKKLRKLREFFRETGDYREAAVLPHGTNETVGLDVVFYRVTS